MFLNVVMFKKSLNENISDTDEIKYFVPLEQMFDVIKRAHIATGHGGRDKMAKEIRKKYVNITDDVLTVFKSFCTEFELKKKNALLRKASWSVLCLQRSSDLGVKSILSTCSPCLMET